MDSAQLESFLAVAHHGSFTQAAQERHLTQPGVSRQVQRLEREVGVRLLERRLGGRRRGVVELTAAGRRFREYAEEAPERRRRLLVELRQEGGALAGELRIAASSTPGEFLVPDLVARFTAEHRLVQPQVFTTDSLEVLAELRERRWDLGFVGVRPTGRDLQYDVVGEDEVVLVVPEGHSFAGRAEVELAELEGQPFLEREGGSGTLLSVRAALERRGLRLPRYRPVMVLNSTQAVLSAVQSGYGMGFVSSLVLTGRWNYKLSQVRLAGISLGRSLYLVRERRRLLPPVAVAFAGWVQEQGILGQGTS